MHVRRGGNAARVDLLHLDRVVQDVAQLPRERVGFRVGQLEIGQRRDGIDLRARES